MNCDVISETEYDLLMQRLKMNQKTFVKPNDKKTEVFMENNLMYRLDGKHKRYIYKKGTYDAVMEMIQQCTVYSVIIAK